ncbi:MAG: alpha-mannosidase [Chthonomonas sp.]|nr:alpha-mannosidase [Chthonomonas sp.]
MQKHPSLTIRRLDSFLAHLKPQLIGEKAPVLVEFCPEPHADETTARKQGPWEAVEPGFKWGPAYRVVWFRVQAEVPAAWEGRAMGLIAELGGERTLWAGNSPARGIDEPHAVCRFVAPAQGGEAHDLLIQAYGAGYHVRVHGEVPEEDPLAQQFKEAHLALINTDLEPLYYDFMFTLDLLKALPETDPAQAALVRAMNDVCNLWEFGGDNRITRARKIIKDALGGLPGEVKHTVTAVGHAHLDTAWLWPLAVTHLKMAHTTANQLYNMERYPKFVFAHSQASQYEWLEQEYPELFQRVLAAAERGQWEPVGSMWVEADCNLSGGESLVRQFLYGRRYFKAKFGTTTDDMWLPDVFGYAASLPQILEKFGIKYFLTQKISWNQINKFPHNTFWWQGIDGTKVWSHFPPADTYIGDCTPGQLLQSVKNHKDHSRSDHSLYLFGWGDGGGGPTEQHIELIQRARDCNMLPEIQVGRTALDFYKEAKKNSNDLVTWSGELYLEMHRGTLTTQAKNKRGNREAEFLIRDAELLHSFAGGEYPQAELERIWKLILLNQFHDIIPGSSVPEVYVDSERDYDDIRASSRRLIQAGLLAATAEFATNAMEHPIAIFANAAVRTQASIPWSGDSAPASLACGDERLPVQLVEEFGEQKLIFATPADALEAVTVADLSSAPAPGRPRLKVGNRRLENDEISVKFDQYGNITSIATLEDHPVEFIQSGKLANLFQLHDDRPLFWDAWDIDPFAFENSLDLVRSESFEVIERGPVRVAVQVVKKFGNSTIRQIISLGPTPGIRFDTEVEWHENHKLLKVAFPVNVNSQRATYEIQYGHVERPTHQNTSWDIARFEVCAQKWADLSEGGHGVALLNNGKYGHDIQGNVMRLSLLRSPKAPDKNADMGTHRFSYVLMPHYDQVVHSDVIAASYALNADLRAADLAKGRTGHAPEARRLVTVDTRHVIVEAVKKAEDDDATIVRLYECHNTRGSAELSVHGGVTKAWLTDLNEREIQELEVHDGRVTFDFKPFEIITIKLTR